MMGIILTLCCCLDSAESVVYQFYTRLGYSNQVALAITALAVHESGYFKSSLTIHHNNVFGMNKPKVRATVALPKPVYTKDGIKASYSTIYDGLYDFHLWLSRYPKPQTAEEFLMLLRRVKYATDPHHYHHVRKKYQQYHYVCKN